MATTLMPRLLLLCAIASGMLPGAAGARRRGPVHLRPDAQLQTLPLKSTKRALSEEEMILYQNFELYAYAVFESLQVANEAADGWPRSRCSAPRRRPSGSARRATSRGWPTTSPRAVRAHRGDRGRARPLRRPAGEPGAAARAAGGLPLPRCRVASGPALAPSRRPARPAAPRSQAWSRARAVLYRRRPAARAWRSRMPAARRSRPRPGPAAPPAARGSIDEAVQFADRPQGDLRPGGSPAADDVCLRPDGLQLRPYRQRPRRGRVRRAVPAAAAALRRRALRPQHHRRGRQDHQCRRRAEGVPIEAIAAALHRAPTTRTWRRSACCRPTVEPYATAHIPEIIAMIAAADRRRATPMPPRATCCSTCPRSRATAGCRGARATR